MPGCPPFHTCRCGYSASFGVIVWIGQKAKGGSPPQLCGSCQQLLVSNPLIPTAVNTTNKLTSTSKTRIFVARCLFHWCQLGWMRSPSSRCSDDSRYDVHRRNVLRISYQSRRYRTQLRWNFNGSDKYGGYDSRIYRSSICRSINTRKC